MIPGFVIITLAMIFAFLLILHRAAKVFERILEVSLTTIKAKDLGEVVHAEQLRKTYDIQAAVMKDNLAKEAEQMKQQRMVKDELSGQLVDLNQFEIM